MPASADRAVPLRSHHPTPARHPPKPPNEVIAAAEQQWIFTEDELLNTPSIQDGMSPEEERNLRTKGINFIWQVGVMLKLPQVTLTTAAVFFNRFLMRRTLVDKKDGNKPLHHYQVAAVTLFLASKIEENCRKIRELITACCRVAQKNPNMLVDEQTKDYWRWRDTILLNEDVLLEQLCFDLSVEAPHKLLFDMLKYYGVEHNKRLRNAAWAFINDSNLTQSCLLFTPRTIAAAALYCAGRHCEVTFPDENGRPWWEVQYVRLKDIRRACNYMAAIYEHVPPKDGGESIYVGLRTPEEEGDNPNHPEKTRLRTSSQTPLSPAPMERGISDQGAKRSRASSSSTSLPPRPKEDVQSNGEGRASKRARTEEKGEEEEEEGSEEGEVEE